MSSSLYVLLNLPPCLPFHLTVCLSTASFNLPPCPSVRLPACLLASLFISLHGYQPIACLATCISFHINDNLLRGHQLPCPSACLPISTQCISFPVHQPVSISQPNISAFLSICLPLNPNPVHQLLCPSARLHIPTPCISFPAHPPASLSQPCISAFPSISLHHFPNPMDQIPCSSACLPIPSTQCISFPVHKPASLSQPCPSAYLSISLPPYVSDSLFITLPRYPNPVYQLSCPSACLKIPTLYIGLADREVSRWTGLG